MFEIIRFYNSCSTYNETTECNISLLKVPNRSRHKQIEVF